MKLLMLVSIDNEEFPNVGIKTVKETTMRIKSLSNLLETGIINTIGESQFEKNCQKFVETFKRHDTKILPKEILMRSIKIPKKDFDALIDTLREQGRVETYSREHEGAGRPGIDIELNSNGIFNYS